MAKVWASGVALPYEYVYEATGKYFDLEHAGKFATLPSTAP
jgi:hypothetical protein